MGLGDWLKGKRKPAEPEDPVRRPDEMITAHDERGREVKIKRVDWARNILEPNLQKAWNDADALYATIVQALRDEFVEQVAAAAERLVEGDGQSERSCVIAGIVRMERGDLAGAERALQLSIDTHGETGVALTNLAKVLDRRGEEERSVATLRRALELDPNQDNGLLWWAAIEKQRRGEPGFAAALEEIAAVRGAWRPQLWLAREKLKAGDRAGALALLDHVVSVAADEPDVLATVTGVLGQAGALEDLVRLAAPRYKPEVHGPHVGMNIVQALKQLGRTDEARAAVRRLQSMPWPPLAGPLAELEKQIVASALPRKEDAVPRVGAMSIPAPIWTRQLFEPSWLFPARPDAISVVLFTLADETRTGGGARVEMADDRGRLTRAIPLYLAEVLQLQSRARVTCALLVVKDQGPAVFGKRLEPRALESSLPPAEGRRILIAGALVSGGLELQVWETGASEAPATIAVEGPLADVAALVGRAERALMPAMAARGLPPEATPPPFYRSPPPDLVAGYASALEQLLYQLMAANGVVRAESLWNERGFFETYFGLVDAWRDVPDSARLVAVCGVLAGIKYGSAIVAPYRKIILEWIDAAPAESVLDRIALAVFQQLGETDRLAAWRKKTRPPADADYAAWVDRAVAG